MSHPTLVTRDSLQQMLDQAEPDKRIHIIGRALVAIFERQTSDEQASNETRELNNVGFTGGDAIGGSLTAKFYLKYNTLHEWQVDRWMKRGKTGQSRLVKYHKQLNEVAVLKMKAKIVHLLNYVNQINEFGKFAGWLELDVFDEEDRTTIRGHLIRDLSPENLTHDGELDDAAVAVRKAGLEQIVAELNLLK